MYIELYLPKSLYSEVLRRVRADLRAAVEARNQQFNCLETLDGEIARLNRLVKDALCCLNETKRQDDLFFSPRRRSTVRKPRSYVSSLKRVDASP